MSWQCEQVLEQLKSLADPQAVAEMARVGIESERSLGIYVPALRKMAKEIGTDHELAQQLWDSKIREARIVASLIADPRLLTNEQMESWVKDFFSWDVCDLCCTNIFRKSQFAYNKAFEWSSRPEEFVKRTGFVLMVCLAVHDKKASDSVFEQFLTIVQREATDDRNFVKKAVNWALRQIGKRNQTLNQKAIDTAKKIQAIKTPGAQWIAANALKELKSKAVQERLHKKKK
jgi:3-methyladenine DNA glycosylase AlkD